MRRLGLAALISLATVGIGCGALRTLAGANTVDLEGADVKSMSVDIRKREKTICPRERVQMAVFADVVLAGEAKVEKLETWGGEAGANRNGKLDFDDFAFHSEHGGFDASGWFTPKVDVLATAAQEISITSVYRRRPDKFSFTTTYKPDYRCIREAGAEGSMGPTGRAGEGGRSGESGSSGSSSSAGGSGRDGSPGSPGGPGGQGGNGPELVVRATFVKTAFYDKLVAVRIEGAVSDVVLFHPENKLVIVARGGAGGGGAGGGRGGDGGSGGGGSPPGAGGTGGPGGNGGNGGSGGPGGRIELIFDERFPELGGLIALDVGGGSAGASGAGGRGGSVGRGGSGSGTHPAGADGNEGVEGASGARGNAGAPGVASKRPGATAERFQDYSNLTVL